MLGASWKLSRWETESTRVSNRRTATPKSGLSRKYAAHAIRIGIRRVVNVGQSAGGSEGACMPRGNACHFAPPGYRRLRPRVDSLIGGRAVGKGQWRAHRIPPASGGALSSLISASNATSCSLMGSWGRSSSSMMVRWWMRVKCLFVPITTRYTLSFEAAVDQANFCAAGLSPRSCCVVFHTFAATSRPASRLSAARLVKIKPTK